MTDRELFIVKVATLAMEILPQYGLNFPSVLTAQVLKESKFGTSNKVINNGIYMHNYLGLKFKGYNRVPIAIGAFNEATKEEYIKGVLTDVPDASWYKFASLRDCIEGYCQFIINAPNNRYEKYINAKTAKDACVALQEAGYATGSTYAISLMNDYITKYNLLKYDKEETIMVRKKIMLDAGHDRLRNQSPVYPLYNEATFAWKLQNYLKEELETFGFEVGTTRASQNEEMDVVVRGKKAKGYDLFISLHSNACGTESVDRPCGIFLCPDNKTSIDETSEKITVMLTDCVRTTMGTKQAAKNYYKLAGYDRNGNGITTDDEYYGVLYGCHSVGTAGLILEHSFHTNKASAMWLYNDTNIRLLAKNEAKVIATFFNADKVVINEEKQITNTVIYTVKAGDTLGGIAKKFGTTVAEIVALNPSITNPNLIVKNKPITVPCTVTELPSEYIVKKGDTLSGIAKKYNTTTVKLAVLNKLLNPNKIYTGQVIKLK